MLESKLLSVKKFSNNHEGFSIWCCFIDIWNKQFDLLSLESQGGM